MFDESIIKKTKQWWKASLAFWGIILSAAMIFIGLTNLENKEHFISLVLIGIFIGVLSFIFGCTAIRCPKCNAPWVWLGVSGKSSNEWLHWMLSRSECPKCNNENT